MYLNKLVFLSLLVTSFTTAHADTYGDFKGCGRYKLAGVIRKDPKDTVVLIVNEKTKSEYRFAPKVTERSRLSGFIDLPISFEAQVVKINGTHGVLSNPKEFKMILPEPLNLKESSGFIKIENSECEK